MHTVAAPTSKVWPVPPLPDFAGGALLRTVTLRSLGGLLATASSLLDNNRLHFHSRFLASADGFAWVLALYLAVVLRFDFEVAAAERWQFAFLSLPAIGVQIACGWWQGLYHGRWQAGSFDGVLALTRAATVATTLVFALNILVGRPAPASVPLAA